MIHIDSGTNPRTTGPLRAPGHGPPLAVLAGSRAARWPQCPAQESHAGERSVESPGEVWEGSSEKSVSIDVCPTENTGRQLGIHHSKPHMNGGGLRILVEFSKFGRFGSIFYLRTLLTPDSLSRDPPRCWTGTIGVGHSGGNRAAQKAHKVTPFPNRNGAFALAIGPPWWLLHAHTSGERQLWGRRSILDDMLTHNWTPLKS